jgi:hypothetical protein
VHFLHGAGLPARIDVDGNAAAWTPHVFTTRLQSPSALFKVVTAVRALNLITRVWMFTINASFLAGRSFDGWRLTGECRSFSDAR